MKAPLALPLSTAFKWPTGDYVFEAEKQTAIHYPQKIGLSIKMAA